MNLETLIFANKFSVKKYDKEKMGNSVEPDETALDLYYLQRSVGMKGLKLHRCFGYDLIFW